MLGNRSITSDLRAQREQIEQRKRLLECVNVETQLIQQFTTNIQHKPNLDSKECIVAVEQTIAAIERVFGAGDWESSLFLRNTIKPLKVLHEQMLELRGLVMGENRQRIVAPPIAPGLMPIYVSLFQTENTHLGKWAMQVRALPKHVQSRPIYRHEAEIQRFILSKLDSQFEAYVVIAIQPEMIIHQEVARVDRNGFKLLTLADSAVSSENIIEFVHQQKRYCLIDNKLVAQG